MRIPILVIVSNFIYRTQSLDSSLFILGAVLIRRRNHKTEIVILDHGLYQKVEDETVQALRGMWRAIVLANDEEMAFCSNILGVKSKIAN